jgi:hypothetical protein
MTFQILPFDSFDEAVQYMQTQTEQANTRLSPEQQALTWGSHWVRVVGDLFIFGWCLSHEAMVEAESQVDDYEDPDEALAEMAGTIATLEDSHSRGYLFSRCHSIVVPEGEYGDVHRYNAWPISEALFEAARAADWTPADMEPEDQQALAAVVATWVAHETRMP